MQGWLQKLVIEVILCSREVELTWLWAQLVHSDHAAQTRRRSGVGSRTSHSLTGFHFCDCARIAIDKLEARIALGLFSTAFCGFASFVSLPPTKLNPTACWQASAKCSMRRQVVSLNVLSVNAYLVTTGITTSLHPSLATPAVPRVASWLR